MRGPWQGLIRRIHHCLALLMIMDLCRSECSESRVLQRLLYNFRIRWIVLKHKVGDWLFGDWLFGNWPRSSKIRILATSWQITDAQTFAHCREFSNRFFLASGKSKLFRCASKENTLLGNHEIATGPAQNQGCAMPATSSNQLTTFLFLRSPVIDPATRFHPTRLELFVESRSGVKSSAQRFAIL